MIQDKTFTLELKNGQNITLKFSAIEATGNRLWQMFATTESLEVVDKIINTTATTIDNDQPSIVKKTPIVTQPVSKKTKNK